MSSLPILSHLSHLSFPPVLREPTFYWTPTQEIVESSLQSAIFSLLLPSPFLLNRGREHLLPGFALSRQEVLELSLFAYNLLDFLPWAAVYIKKHHYRSTMKPPVSPDSLVSNLYDSEAMLYTKYDEKIALVLDMDECLVHTRFLGQVRDYRQAEDRPDLDNSYPDSFEIIMSDGEGAIVNKRPGLDAFLQKAAQHFDLYLYSAAEEIYGEAVVKVLDPDQQLFKKVFYRDSCVQKAEMYLKDLYVASPNMARTILVDNNFASFLLQPSNGIPVPSFYDDEADDALTHLWTILITQFADWNGDVRTKLAAMFSVDKMLDQYREYLGEDECWYDDDDEPIDEDYLNYDDLVKATSHLSCDDRQQTAVVVA